MNENKIKGMINVEILNRMNDGSASAVLKNILFSDKNNIDLTEFEILTVVMFKYFLNIFITST